MSPQRHFVDVVAPAKSDWIEGLRARGPADVGEAFGLEHDRRCRALSPCPACGSEKRHPSRHDHRGAVGLTHDGGGWRCHECDKGGDAVGLAAWLAVGRVPEKGDPAWREVRAACAARGLCEPDPRDGDAPRLPLRPVPPRRTETPLVRPPAAEVRAAWEACRPVVDEADVSRWLAGRSLEPAAVAGRDLARALPAGPAPPSWMRFEGLSWDQSTHRVIVPLYGARGTLESLHARALEPRQPNGRDKAASPAGAEVRGLVMADATALAMLAGEGIPAKLLIAEGVPDFLTWATQYGDAAEDAPAIIGVISGSWTDELAARVPDGADVYVRTHEDEAGHRYADRIEKTLAERCRVYRAAREGARHGA